VFGLTESDVNSLRIFSQFTELNKLTKSDKEIVEKFLEKRGISLAEALEYKIRYFSATIVIDETLKKRYNERVIVPLFDISGNLVFFTGRSTNKDAKFKYLNCDVKRKRFLPVYMGKENPNTVLLVEGVFDAIAVHQAGFSAIPLLSMDVTPLQVFALLGIGFDKIVIALDSGEFDSSLKLYQKLIKVGLSPYILFRVGEDLDCVSRASIKEMVSHLLSLNQDSQRENLLREKAINLMKARR
jgi:DNA primase